MLSDCDDPLGHGQQNGGSSLFLVGAVVGHDACVAVKGLFGGANICFLIEKVIISISVCHHIHRILQDRFDGKPGEVLSLFGFDPGLLHKFFLLQFHSSYCNGNNLLALAFILDVNSLP